MSGSKANSDEMDKERSEWRARPANKALAKRLNGVVWVVSAGVLGLVVLMQRVRLPLPEGVTLDFLPPFHAAVNVSAASVLVAALIFIKRGEVARHRAAMMGALILSLMFLLSYVAYHITHDPTPYRGEGLARNVYFFLLITHIIGAAVSFPFILLSFVAAWTNHFRRHRRLVRWVYPVWLYVAVTGPLCYWMLQPYY